MGARPAIPPHCHQAPVACPPWIYVNRNRVERLWARLKEWRAVATRYEKTACSFMGVLCIAATMDWIKQQRRTQGLTGPRIPDELCTLPPVGVERRREHCTCS